MKNILYPFILALLVLAVGCEEEEHPVYQVLGDPAFTSPAGGTTYVLLEENEEDTLVSFTWDPANYGFQAPVTYRVHLDEAGNNFQEPRELGKVTETKLEVTVGKMNSALLAMGMQPEQPANVEVRIMATVHPDLDTLYSTPLALTITPFEKIIVYPKLYVPGSYQNEWNPDWAEWDAANEHTTIFSVKDDGKYEGYLYFNEAEVYHKFTMVPGWEEDYTIGDPDPGGESGTLQIGSWGGNNIKVVTGGAGVFLVKANLNDATYSHTKTHWGLIGSATPGEWDYDTDMTYDPIEDVWTLTVDLTAGEIKFRANDGWDINLGDTGPDGKLEYGGDNIAIAEAGNYTITLDLSNAIYTYTVTKN
ncbi:MAG TPA: SusF/SusE family outer membrane protein [Bacteroidetes bacterium]|nr:SusF/SusE family outer membrane protein [Bacteroidota bacterium]